MNCYTCKHELANHFILKVHPDAKWDIACIETKDCKCDGPI